MRYLSEDPWPLVSVLGVLALAFLVALWLTQQGKYLVRAGIALALAALVLVIEHFWVTENERIEAVIYDLARAVEASDADRVADHLTSDCRIVVSGSESAGTPVQRAVMYAMDRFLGIQLTRELLRSELTKYRFDYLRVARLTTQVYPESRRGRAEFVTHLMGQQVEPEFRAFASDPAGIAWSLGLRKTDDGQWKVDRISPALVSATGRAPVRIRAD